MHEVIGTAVMTSVESKEEEELPTTMPQDEWAKSGNKFSPSNKANKVDKLPAGVYEFRVTMTGWYLEKVRNTFTFPYKIYGSNNNILRRIKKAWQKLDGNVGVLLNGIRGTGKTVTAQVIANWVITTGVPVLVVKTPVDILGDLLKRINQPLMVIFDEFEKTHKEIEHQEGLLSAIDGISRNEHKRLFVFTTNTTHIDKNFLDRPSRIRYKWEFSNLDLDIINELIDDILDRDCERFRASIVSYLQTREVCSIDTVKSVIKEVNVFKEDPEAFKDILNLNEIDYWSYKISIIDDKEKVIKVWAENFYPEPHQSYLLKGTPQGITAVSNDSDGIVVSSLSEGKALRLLSPGKTPNTWLVNLTAEAKNTWMKEFPKILTQARSYDSMSLWIDKKPSDWQPPIDPEDETHETLLCTIFNRDLLYGTADFVKFLIKIEPQLKPKSTLGRFSTSYSF